MQWMGYLAKRAATYPALVVVMDQPVAAELLNER
jgi:hypothetical protein